MGGFSPALNFPTNYPTTPWGGSNQFMTFPSLPNPGMSPPGIVPTQGSKVPSPTGGHEISELPSGYMAEPSMFPGLTGQMSDFLQNQLGKGAQPFDLSALLPSTGQATAPGTLTAPMNPLMQQLNDFLMGKSGAGGPNSFILPLFQSQMAAMQQPTQENLAMLKEQFGSQGALGSTEMARAMSDYLTQTTLNQQSLLGQETLQALPQYQSEAAATQQLDQAAIQNMLNEFIRTSPDYNPLLNAMFGLATTFQPMYGKQGFLPAFMGSLGGALGKSAGTFGVSLPMGGGT